MKKHIILSLLWVASALSLWAVPADPRWQTYQQPNGQTIQIRLVGDEHFHFFTSQDGIPILRGQDGTFHYAQLQNNQLITTNIPVNNTYCRTEAEIDFISQYDKEQTLRALQTIHADKTQQTTLRPTRMAKQEQTSILPKTLKALAILVEFPLLNPDDEYVQFSTPEPQKLFSDMLNKQGFDYDGATGSVHDYFYDSSNGQFDLQFDVFGPVELYYDISHYGENIMGEDLNAWKMAVEACQALDKDIDFSQYDTNQDGFIDNIYIFYAGQGEANGGEEYTVWPHAADIETITGEQYIFDGVRLNHYACSNEMVLRRDAETNELVPRLEGIGTVCHEFSHILGLPDLYDITQSGAYTPATWSLMDIGSYNNNSHTPPLLSAYEQYALGWLKPTILSAQSKEYTLQPLAQKQDAYLIPTSSDNEYFILENRQPMGWDTYLPGHGMIVWHIDYDPYIWNKNQVNIDPYHQRIDLVEAGGDMGIAPRTADPFPGTDNITTYLPSPWTTFPEVDGVMIDYALTDIYEDEDGSVHFNLNAETSINYTHANTNIRTEGNTLHITTDQAICQLTIYTPDGTTILSQTIQQPSLTITLPTQGLYIVKIANQTFKVHI